MLRQNLLLFLRLFARQKVFFMINMTGLAIGLASSFFLFTYANYELSFDSHHERAEQLFRVTTTSARCPVPLGPILETQIAGIEKSCRMIFTTSGSRFIVSDSVGNLFEENGYYVDSTFLDMFTFDWVGVKPDKPLQQPDEVVITKRLAEKYFENGNALNKQLVFANNYLQEKVYQIVGVIENLPHNSQFNFDLLLPFSKYGSAESTLWTNNLVYTFAQLSPDVDPNRVHNEIKKLFAREANYSAADLDQIQFQPFRSLHFDNTYTFDFGPHNTFESIIILISIATLIVFIACINFINLSTAKASERMKEVGLRKTVGAYRWNLMLQFIGESIVVTMLAALVATCIIYLLSPGFEILSGVSFRDALATAQQFILYVPLLIVGIGVLAGLYPAYIISKFQPLHALKGNAFNNKSALRNALVIVQFSITSFLIICTLVIAGQLHFIRNKNLGFDTEQIVILNVGGPGINDRIHTLRQELKENSNVINVSGTLTIPGDNTYTMPYSNKENITPEELSEGTDLAGLYVDHEFVDNMKLEVINGRSFMKESGTDTSNFILNESAVKELTSRFGQEWNDPIGKQLHYFRSSDSGWYRAKSGTVIGIVKDFHIASLHHEIRPLVIQVDYNLLFKVLVKIKPADIPSTLDFIKSKWESLGIERPFNYQFLDERFAMAYEKEQKFEKLFTLFALISIAVSCMGLYGLVLYNTERRSREISIRKVFGANTATLLAMLGTSFIKPVVLAFLLVSPLAYFLMSNWLSQFAFRTTISWDVFLKGAAVCVLVSFLTIFTRTLKVSKTNPIKYLRDN